ncbi:MAG: hypothetical protein NTV60_01225, partial [Candidatus Kaiserbacteria bacterium]|nr:hypothetical protein [Candidatus Kaiserbacteria bacterium]
GLTHAVVAKHDLVGADPEQNPLPPVHVPVCVEASKPQSVGHAGAADQVPVGQEAPLRSAAHVFVAGVLVEQYPLPPTQVYEGVEAVQVEVGQVGAVQVPVGHSAALFPPFAQVGTQLFATVPASMNL